MKYCQNCGNAMNDADERCGMCGMRADIPVQPTAASSMPEGGYRIHRWKYSLCKK